MKIPMTAAVTLLAALTISPALTACGTTAPPPAHRHVDELGAPNIPVRVPGAAQCPTASTLGQNIACGHGYSGTGFPSRAVLRGWDKQLVSGTCQPL